MDLSTGRNLALILLALEAFVLGLPLLLVLYYAWRGIRRLQEKIPPILQKVYRWVSLGERITKGVRRAAGVTLAGGGGLLTGLLDGLRMMIKGGAEQ
ncbi:MAG: hypothetical protein ACE5NP_10380 [Anaerolineae bacterium]